MKASTTHRNKARRVTTSVATIPVALLTVILAALPAAQAAIFTWDGGDAFDSNWSSPTNWGADTAPTGLNQDEIRLHSDTDVSNTIVDAPNPFRLQILKRQSGATTASVSGNPLWFGLAGDASQIRIQPDTGNLIISNDIYFLATDGSSVQPGSGRTITFAGDITSDGPLLFTRGGTPSGITWVLTSNATLAASSLTVNKPGGTGTFTLRINSSNTLADQLELFLATSSGSTKVDLNFTGKEVVSNLYLNGVLQSSGTWGATGSGAMFINDAFFTGSGMLEIIPEPSAVLLLAGTGLVWFVTRRRP